MGGDRPIGLAIGIVVTAALVFLPAVFVPIYYLFANVVAVIAGSDLSSDTVNVAVLLVGVVLTVATLLLLVAGAVSLVGRALSPRNPEA